MNKYMKLFKVTLSISQLLFIFGMLYLWYR